MLEFTYTGTFSNGERTSGTLSASDRKTALRVLKQRGVIPIKLAEGRTMQAGTKPRASAVAKPETTAFAPSARSYGNGSVSANQALGLKFAQRLLELHSGGMSLGDSVFLLSQRLTEKKLKAVATEVWSHLREGKSFAKSVESIRNLFPRAMLPLFEAGEASGDMAAILKNTIEYIQENQALKKRILGSLAYPFLLMSMVVLIMVLFLYYLVPKIQMMIESMGGQMNVFTSFLISFSNWMIGASPFLALAFFIGFIVLSQWRRTKTGRLITDKWALKIPVMGLILETSNLYQLSSLMCTLMESGINTSENLKLSEKTIQNQWMRTRFLDARNMIIEGASFAVAFKHNGIFPDSAIDILTVGENTGNLEHGLREINKAVRQILDSKIKQLTVLVSSGAMMLAFFMVTFAALGMVMSVLEVSQTISLQ